MIRYFSYRVYNVCNEKGAHVFITGNRYKVFIGWAVGLLRSLRFV